MRDVWQPGNRANIPPIRLGVQDQCVGGCTGWHLAIGPPGQSARLHLTKAQRDWLVIVRPDFHNHFCHRPLLGAAQLSHVENAWIVGAIDPERPASDQAHVSIVSQVGKVLHLWRGPQGALLWR